MRDERRVVSVLMVFSRVQRSSRNCWIDSLGQSMSRCRSESVPALHKGHVGGG